MGQAVHNCNLNYVDFNNRTSVAYFNKNYLNSFNFQDESVSGSGTVVIRSPRRSQSSSLFQDRSIAV